MSKMVIKINLLPQTDRPSTLPVARIIAGVVTIGILFCASAFSYHTYVIWSLTEELTAARNQHESLRPVELNMNTATEKLKYISQREVALSDIAQERRPWDVVFSHLAAIAPQRLWFTHAGVDYKEKAQPMGIKISGIAEKYLDVATFLNTLEQDDTFCDPVLTAVELNSGGKVQSAKFEITVNLKGLKK